MHTHQAISSHGVSCWELLLDCMDVDTCLSSRCNSFVCAYNNAGLKLYFDYMAGLSAMFFHMIWTHVWFLVFYFLWSFVCVFFHIITWLLSFFYQDYVFYNHIFSSFDPALNVYIDDQDYVGACHLKNYSFVITYLLEDEQELSLRILNTSQTYL
jgi:hypothetical protein